MTQTPRTENFERLLDHCYPSGFDQATRTWNSWPEYARALELETIDLKRQLAEAQRDAERYRYLRNKLPDVASKWSLTRLAAGLPAGDAEIDAAIQEQKK